MQKAQRIRQEGVKDLYERIWENRHFYQEGGFVDKYIHVDKIVEEPAVEIDEDALSSLNPAVPDPANPKNTRRVEIENALLVWNSLHGMHPHLARDEGFWVYLTHSHCRDYTWKRWAPSATERLGEDASEEVKKAFEKRILERFFNRGSDNFIRHFMRSNAISRLWWWVELVSRYESPEGRDDVGVKKILEVAHLTNPDVLDALISRPSITRGVNGFSTIVDVLVETYDEDPQSLLFKTDPFRAWLKEINRHGGVLLLEAMPRDKLKDLFGELAVQVVRGQVSLSLQEPSS